MRLKITFGQFDPEAKADSTVSLVGAAPWSDPVDIKTDNVMPGDYMTCEDNFVILDGSKTEFPDDTSSQTWGLFSSAMSDANGNFTSPPGLDITFSANHKSPGLTLLFYPFNDDYAATAVITWYNASNAVIASGTYTLNSVVGVVRESVENIRRITIRFPNTNIPRRYIKLYGIEYGIAEVFSDDIIDTAELQESTDPISDTLEVNTLRFSIKTHSATISLISGNLEDNMLMKNQRMDITADSISYGTFFLDTWGDLDGSEVNFDFSAIDAVGVMDKYKFYGGLYNNYPLASLLDDIFAVAFPTGLIRYILDAELQGLTITGHLPILTCREALQRVCFVTGGIADTSRRNYVWIYKRSTTPEFYLPLERIYTRSPVRATDFYSGVEVTSYDYRQNNDAVTAFDGALSPGAHRIEFSEPMWGVAVTGATLVRAHVNYADINVTAAGTVVISGKGYTNNANIVGQYDASLPAGEVESIATFDGVGIVHAGNAGTLATSLLQYLQYRIRLTPDVRLDGEEVGMVGDAQTHKLPVRGIIESLSMDVRSGRANAVIVGSIVEG